MSALTLARSGFSKIFELSKEEVTVRSIVFTRSTQDDITPTPTSYRTYAKIERGGRQNSEEDRGRLGDADLGMYFPYSFTSGLTPGNYVTYNSVNYKIMRVSPYRLAGSSLVYTKVFLKESEEALS